MRHRRVTFAGAVIATCCCLYTFLSPLSLSQVQPVGLSTYQPLSLKLKALVHPESQRVDCSDLRSYTHGDWVSLEDNPITELQQLGINASRWVDKLECRPVYSPEDESKVNRREEQIMRSLKTANWRWRPDSCTSPPPNGMDILLQLLRMPHGIFFVGDSLTKQQRDALVLMLNGYWGDQSGQSLTKDTVTGGYIVRNAESHYLNPDHPVVQSISKYMEGDQLAERLRAPIINLYWNSHMVDNPTLGNFVMQAGGRDSGGRRPQRYPNYKDDFWRQALESSLKAYDSSSLKNPAQTVLVLGTGAHWSNRCIFGLVGEDPSDQIMEIYESVVKRTVDDLTALHNSDRLRVIYRTNNPTTLPCAKHYEPLHTQEQVDALDWGLGINWGLFPAMDAIWPKYGVDVLNTTVLLKLRPDARRDPMKPDCLHVCLPIAFAYNEIMFGTLPRS